VQSRGKAIGFSLAVIILLGLFAFAASHLELIRKNVGNRDSVQYWATGHLLVDHQNPYDPYEVLDLERSQGHAAELRPLMFRVPPWGLLLVAPFGLLDPFWAWFVWFSCSLAAVVISVRTCRSLFGVDGAGAHDCALAAYLFAPVLACLEAGQIDAFLLLGMVLFLRWEKERPFWAGVALLLPFAKPHLFFVFGVACLSWMIWRRRLMTLAGFAAGLIVCLAVALWFDPAVFAHYRAMLAQQAIGEEFIPSLAGVLRLLVAHQFFWVQFLPAAVGAGWAAWFWAAHRTEWNWREHGPIVLLVSVLVSPYAWLPDEIVLLPVVFQAAGWLFGGRISRKVTVSVSALIALNVLLVVMAVVQVPLPSGAYVWSGLVWVAWYGLGRRVGSQRRGVDKLRRPHETLTTVSSAGYGLRC
jgi:hypothetical protein